MILFCTIHLIEANQEKVDWYMLSSNVNAIHILEENKNDIYWYELSCNPNAIHVLEKYQKYIDWYMISRNPSIFQWDYTFYRERMDVHREELMKAVFHPKRLKRSLELGYDLFNELE